MEDDFQIYLDGLLNDFRESIVEEDRGVFKEMNVAVADLQLDINKHEGDWYDY